MYTSCPECGTVFRISTGELRVAEGFVRCGQCSATFNALASLSDDPPPTVTLRQLSLPAEPDPVAFAAPTPEPEPESVAEPALELETEPQPEPEPEPEPALPAGTPAREAEAERPLSFSDDTLEFDIPEDSWTNFFEATPPAAATAEAEAEAPVAVEVQEVVETFSDDSPEPDEPELPPPAEPPAYGAADVGEGFGSDTVDQAGLYRALAAERGSSLDDDADWQALLDEVPDDDAVPEPVYVIGDDGSPAAPRASGDEPDPVPDPVPIPDPEPVFEPEAAPGLAPLPLPADFAPEFVRPGPRDGPPGPAAGDEAPRAPPIADRPFVWTPPPPPPADTGRHWGYTAGSVLAAVLLITQLIHLQRDELATNPKLTEPLQRTYAALGLPLWPAWDLRAYELRSSEAVADRSSPGALDVLARIAVVGNEPVGMPLVRVTLRDRFGKPLGSRVFQPAEYLARNPRPREPVSPGTLIPVEISLKDPGRDAQGFDVDVCLMSRRDGVTCRGEREPFAR